MKRGSGRLMPIHRPIMTSRRSAARATFLASILGLIVLHGVPSLAEDLQTAYRQAASSSPLLAQARAQLDVDLVGKPLARSVFLPHIQAGASGGMNTAYVQGFGPEPISTGYHSDSFSASLSQSIFNGQALTAMKRSGSRIQASEAALAYTEQVVVLNVIQAYFGVLEAQANQRVAQQQMNLIESIDKRTRTSLRVGTGDIISVQEVQAQLDAVRADLVNANSAVTIAKSQLERLTHQPIGTLQDITTLEPSGPQPDTIGPWLAEALKNQPLLKQAKATLKAAEQQVQYAKRARWPTLALNGIGQHATGTLIPSLAIDQIGGSLSLSIPIYAGGKTRAEIHQAEARSRATHANLTQIRDQIVLDTQTAFQDLENSVARFRATQQSVKSAKVSLDGTRKGYEIGSRSIIDLLTSTTNYATAQRNYYLALYTQVVTRTQLKAAVGVLTPQDIAAINSLLVSNSSNSGATAVRLGDHP